MKGNVTFGHWVKRRRKELDLTQQQLAQLLNYAPVTIYKIEAGERQPAKEQVELLIEHLQIAEEQQSAFRKAARPPMPSVPHIISIPVPPNRLVGRDGDLINARSRLLRDDTRLLTLIGPPGIGKTRLSWQLASEVRPEFEDDAPFVDLTLVKEASQVAESIAASLQLKLVGEARQQLKHYLADKRMLLVLDNFEHVLDAAGLVAELLATCAHLKILVTSRVALTIPGEWQFMVQPLALPNPQEEYRPDVLFSYASVALFYDRAQAVVPDFSFTSDIAKAVVEICVRLEGIPLAIELVAARVNLFTVQSLLKRLDKKRLGEITESGSNQFPEHQRTLRGTLEWSYHLLDAEGQALFARLGVFVGGCTFEAVEQVCEGDGLNVMRTLDTLINSSLVKQITGPDGEPRYTMLETIRELMLEKLAENGEEDRLRREHARFYVALAEQAEPYLRGKDQMMWLARLEADHHNLRAALAWSLEHAPEMNLRLASALGWFWWLHAHLNEARGWLTVALERNPDAEAALRAKALQYCLPVAIGLGDCDWGLAVGAEALHVSDQLQDYKMQAETLMCLSICYGAAGDPQRAAQASQEALSIAQEIGDLRTTTAILFQMGLAHPDSAQSVALAEESLRLARESGQQWRTFASLQVLVMVAHKRDELHLQGKLLDDILALCREIGDRRSSALIVSYQAEFSQHRGDLARAARLLHDAMTLSWELSDRPLVIIHLVQFASLARAQNQLNRAACLLGAAAAAMVTTGVGLFPGDQSYYERVHADIHSQLDERAFTAAWGEGRLMSLERAVAYALSQEADVPQGI
jgi:predicted ATPase/DNA-binding XRE family transcriptional regulator